MVIKRIFFILFLFLILSLQRVEYLLIAMGILWVLSIKNFFIVNRKVLKSIIFFNLGVTFGYAVMAQHSNPWEYLVYINLKVYTLTYYVFWFFSTVSVVQFMAFSKDLGFLTTIALSQIFSYKKSFEDFRLSFISRGFRLKDKNPKFITRTFEFFLNKALRDANERTLAMKARGFFDD